MPRLRAGPRVLGPWLALHLLLATAWRACGDDGGGGSPRRALVRQVEGMYDHAFGSYMMHAFPDDELRPLSCDGRRVRERGDMDAVLGNFSMTLIDALDSLVVFRRYADFDSAVTHIVDNVDFDLDIEVSTFEVNIRVLGGLLSGHLHATRLLGNYSGGLLAKALDLATRLRAAFQTPTGMPLSRVNLRSGKPKDASSAVTIAEAGSFLLEFGVVSMLTGDTSFYGAARRSLFAFWGRRSSLDLVGTTIDVNTGEFQDATSTTGPGQDSFYEYLLKGYILFDDLELLDIFHDAYAAVEQYHQFEGFSYSVDMFKGMMSNTNLSPLACVWGSLQVLLGDVAGGLRTILYWYGLWTRHGALPEVVDTKTEQPTNFRDSPLRPELIEAVFYLSQALPEDPVVFDMAQNMVSALDAQSRVKCGFAALGDVVTKRLDDRMDSFFLSETLVYLYLAAASPQELQRNLHWPLSSVVFSTNGHMFPLPHVGGGLYKVAKMPGIAARVADLYPASAQQPLLTCDAISPFERIAVQERCKTKYLLTSQHQLQSLGYSSMLCRPQEAFVLARNRSDAGTLLRLRGIVSSFGPAVPALPSLLAGDAASPEPSEGTCSSPLAAAACGQGAAAAETPEIPWPRPLESELGLARLDLDLGPGLMPPFTSAGAKHLHARELFATRRAVVAEPESACSPLRAPKGSADGRVRHYEGQVVIVTRGSCLFLQKMQNLQQVRASGALIINHENHQKELQVMTCPLQEKGAGRDVHIPAIMVSHADGAALLELLRSHGDAMTLVMFAAH